jgi:glycosyltransferase involved in cell wall biosynthesis
VINRAYVGALRNIRRPVVWIPSGVDTQVMSPGPASPQDAGSAFRILLPGRPERPKGVVFAASLLPNLAARIGRPVSLLFTGEAEPEVAQEIEAAAADQWPNVHFLPWREHGAAMADLYRSVDVVILPSTSESCGLVLLEAMACRTPVVASPQANASRTIRNRQSGLCAPLDSRSDWTKALTELATNAALRARLAASGASAVRRRHKPREMYAGYTQLFTASGALQP